MSRNVLMVGTRKGLWIGTSDEAREDWEFTGPHHDMEEVYSCMVDTRSDPAAALRRRVVELARAAGAVVRRPRRDLAGDPGRRHPVPRGHRRDASSGSGSSCPASSDGDGVGRHRARCRLALDRPRRDVRASSGSSGTTRTAREWGAGFGGQAFHTILPHPTDPDSVTVAISTGGVYQTDDGGASWEPRNQGIRAEFLPEGQQYPEFGQCVHKVTRHPSPSRAAVPAEPRRRLPLRRPRRRRGTTSATGCPPTSGSRSSCTRTSRTRSSSSRSAAATGRYPPDGKARVWRSRDAGDSWEELGDGLPDDFFVGGDARRHVRRRPRPRRALRRCPQRRRVGVRRLRARAGARSWPTCPDVMVVRAAAY